MIVYLYIKNFFYGFFYLLDSWVTKLFDLSCIGIDKMIVLVIEIGFFVLCLILSKLMLPNQTAIQ